MQAVGFNARKAKRLFLVKSVNKVPSSMYDEMTGALQSTLGVSSGSFQIRELKSLTSWAANLRELIGVK